MSRYSVVTARSVFAHAERLGSVEGKDLARSRVRVEVIDEGCLFARRNVRERQRLEWRVQCVREPINVSLRLYFDVPHERTGWLRLANADRLPIEEEQVVYEPVAFVELEFPNSDGWHRDVHFVSVLDGPACVFEQPVDLVPGASLGCVLASGGRHLGSLLEHHEPRLARIGHLCCGHPHHRRWYRGLAMNNNDLRPLDTMRRVVGVSHVATPDPSVCYSPT
jgi:hypothetical protein